MRPSHPLIVALVTALSLVPSALRAETESSTPRPHDPWVFRSILDQRARIITIALSEKLWVAYDAKHNGLYRAWPGGVKFTGAVYNHAHGPQPTVKNPVVYYTQLLDTTWALRRHGKPVETGIRYRGYLLDGTESVTLRYTFEAGDQVVTIRETPRFVQDDGRVGLAQDFTIQGLPADATLVLTVGGDQEAQSTRRAASGQAKLIEPEDPGQRRAVRFTGNGDAALITTWEEAP